MFLIAGVGALIVWVLRKNMPESPRWLESQGRFDEAERIVRMVEAASYRSVGPIGSNSPKIQPAIPTKVLFSRSVARLSILAVCLNITVQSSVWVLNGWLPSFLVKQGLTVSSSLGFAALLSLGSVAGTLARDCHGGSPRPRARHRRGEPGRHGSRRACSPMPPI